MQIYAEISFISIFSLVFLVFKHELMRCVDFTRTASDDVTKQVTHRIFNTDLLYSYANFVVEIGDKSSLNGGF